MNILDLVADKSISVYYDHSLDKVVCYFYNTKKAQKDLVGYLNTNTFCWDLRRVIKETSTLTGNSETVIIEHENVAMFDRESDFYKLIQKYVKGLIAECIASDDKEIDPVLGMIDNLLCGRENE